MKRVRIDPTILPVTRTWLKEKVGAGKLTMGELIDNLVLNEMIKERKPSGRDTDWNGPY